MLNYLKASISAPGLFSPVTEDNSSLADGTTTASADIPEAINRCREIVDNDSDIILDVIMVQEVKSLVKNCSNYNGIQMLLRYVRMNIKFSWKSPVMFPPCMHSKK